MDAYLVPINFDAEVYRRGHIVFTSSTTFTGSLGGLSGADTQCQSLALAEGLPDHLSYKAILSDSTNNAKDRLGVHMAIHNVLGETVALNADGLWGGSLLVELRRAEDGTMLSSDRAWSNTLPDGTKRHTATSNTCMDWTSTSGTGSLGDITSNSNNWIDFSGSHTCSNSRRLYCIGNNP